MAETVWSGVYCLRCSVCSLHMHVRRSSRGFVSFLLSLSYTFFFFMQSRSARSLLALLRPAFSLSPFLACASSRLKPALSLYLLQSPSHPRVAHNPTTPPQPLLRHPHLPSTCTSTQPRRLPANPPPPRKKLCFRPLLFAYILSSFSRTCGFYMPAFLFLPVPLFSFFFLLVFVCVVVNPRLSVGSICPCTDIIILDIPVRPSFALWPVEMPNTYCI